jgi:hypothetical protein
MYTSLAEDFMQGKFQDKIWKYNFAANLDVL